MRVKKSEINGFLPKIFKKKEPASLPSQDKAEILAAIKDIKLEPAEPVIVEQKIPDEILEQQRAMMAKLSEEPVPPDFPSYHFEVNRTSDGFIKSVDATPTNIDNVDDRNIAKSWYEKPSKE